MAIITEHLQLNKQFLIIDSPVPFTLIANNGTDEVYRMAGAWQIDTHKLLPEKYQKQYPVFNLDLVYDDTNLNGGTVTVRESNIDIGDGISGVNGQDVKVTNFSELIPYLEELKKKFFSINTNVISDIITIIQNNVPVTHIKDDFNNEYDIYVCNILSADGVKVKLSESSEYTGRIIDNTFYDTGTFSVARIVKFIGFTINNGVLQLVELRMHKSGATSNFYFDDIISLYASRISYIEC